MFTYLRAKLNLNYINRSAKSFYLNNNRFLTKNIDKCYSEFSPGTRSLHLDKCYPSQNKLKDLISTNKRPVEKFPRTPLSLTSNDEKREFMAVFPDLVKDLTDANMFLDMPEVAEYCSKMTQYNVPDGKKDRGLAIVQAYLSFTSVEEHTPENIRLAQIVGWSVEIMQAFMLMLDDIIDGSVTRRGRPCWYRNEDVGLFAINDAMFIEWAVYYLLRKHISKEKYYLPILELFHEFNMKTAMGQILESIIVNSFRTSKFEKFTMEFYTAIAKNKTFYSFYVPIRAAMHMAGVYDDKRDRQAKNILWEIGYYFQVQDDYLDCFGDPAKTGKIGTDIKDAKCSWVIIMALQRANAEQKKILEECYGVKDEEKENTVKEIYKQLDLPGVFAKFEKETYDTILTQIQQISCGLPKEVFFKLLDKIYKRQI